MIHETENGVRYDVTHEGHLTDREALSILTVHGMPTPIARDEVMSRVHDIQPTSPADAEELALLEQWAAEAPSDLLVDPERDARDDYRARHGKMTKGERLAALRGSAKVAPVITRPSHTDGGR